MRRRPEEEHIWGGAGPSFQNIYRARIEKKKENNNKKEMAHHFKMCTIRNKKKMKKNNEIVNHLQICSLTLELVHDINPI